MADTPKSLWSKWMEGSRDIEIAKHACPYDQSSCTKSLIGATAEGGNSSKSSSQKCHPECPEPKRPLQPEEFCPELGKVKPPPPPQCCFIRMQDPCAPCCCPPPTNCEDECRPGPKRDPICGCDLCKKRKCPDGKCCGPTEPSCQKVVHKCDSESQTSPECSTKPPKIKVPEVYSRPEMQCDFPVCRCERNNISVMELARWSLDWLLCTLLKIPVPHIEWRTIGGPVNKERKQCDSAFFTPKERIRCHSRLWNGGDCSRRARFPDFRNSPDEGSRFFHDDSGCTCGPCRVRRLFEGSSANRVKSIDGNKHLGNAYADKCDCRPCRVRRTIEKPIF